MNSLFFGQIFSQFIVFCKKTMNNSIVVLEVSIVEMTNVIKSLKESSPGWDNIPAFIL